MTLIKCYWRDSEKDGLRSPLKRIYKCHSRTNQRTNQSMSSHFWEGSNTEGFQGVTVGSGVCHRCLSSFNGEFIKMFKHKGDRRRIDTRRSKSLKEQHQTVWWSRKTTQIFFINKKWNSRKRRTFPSSLSKVRKMCGLDFHLQDKYNMSFVNYCYNFILNRNYIYRKLNRNYIYRNDEN